VSTEESRYSGKVLLVTGGTSGVGFHAARRFAAGAGRVHVTGRDAGRGADALRRLAELPGAVTFHAVDSADSAAVSELARSIAEEDGVIDVLVSAGNSGAVGPRPFSEMSSRDVADEMDTLFNPRVIPVVASLPAMAAGGSISMRKSRPRSSSERRLRSSALEI
jgi:NAD(P)-dependent dehydrogenase (short-subunit alcohol dehydrogenase family)